MARGESPSRSPRRGEYDEAAAQHMECPVCMELPMLPPIRQCPNGHTLCDGCAAQVGRCPTCTATPVNIRNLGMERLAESLRFSCKHAPLCSRKVMYGELTAHAGICKFRPIRCPVFGAPCTSEVPMCIDVICEHLEHRHGFDIPAEPSGSATWRLLDPVTDEQKQWDGPMLRAGGCIFLSRCALERGPSGEQLYVWLKQVGRLFHTQGLYRATALAIGLNRRLIFEGPVNPGGWKKGVNCLGMQLDFAVLTEGSARRLNVEFELELL